VAQLSHKPEGTVFSRRGLSKQTRIRPLFLAKILQVLGRAGLLRSHRGLQRGYSINRLASEITLLVEPKRIAALFKEFGSAWWERPGLLAKTKKKPVSVGLLRNQGD
jgi:DNA-binding transcriptional regulator YhcF (GntR family)